MSLIAPFLHPRCLPNVLLYLSDTFPLPLSPVRCLCFSTLSFHFLPSPSHPSLSLWENGKMMKSFNETPSQPQHKMHLVWREILQTKRKTAKRKKSIKFQMGLKLQPCLPLQPRSVSPPFRGGSVFASLTKLEFSTDASWSAEFRCECRHV